jgi:hypothetical protein
MAKARAMIQVRAANLSMLECIRVYNQVFAPSIFAQAIHELIHGDAGRYNEPAAERPRYLINQSINPPEPPESARVVASPDDGLVLARGSPE